MKKSMVILVALFACFNGQGSLLAMNAEADIEAVGESTLRHRKGGIQEAESVVSSEDTGIHETTASEVSSEKPGSSRMKRYLQNIGFGIQTVARTAWEKRRPIAIIIGGAISLATFIYIMHLLGQVDSLHEQVDGLLGQVGSCARSFNGCTEHLAENFKESCWAMDRLSENWDLTACLRTLYRCKDIFKGMSNETEILECLTKFAK